MIDNIETVKEIQDSITGELVAYKVNGVVTVPVANGNVEYKKVIEWIEDGNTPEPYMTAEEINTQRIADIKAKAQELILEIYPLHKQNNVLMSSIQVDIDTMNSFISNIRNISNKAEANGTELLDIVW